MTENKRFELKLCSNGTYYVYENGTLTDIDFDKFNKESADALIDEVNALYENNEQLKSEYKVLHTQYQDLKKFVENNFDEYLTQEKLNRQIIKLSDENEQLRKELKVYRKLARCSNCEYHGYDWFSDGEEFEVCDKGNDVTERICEEWRNYND